MRRRTAGNSVGGAGAPKDVIASESEASDVPHRGYAADSDGDSGASDFGSEVGERAPALKDEKDMMLERMRSKRINVNDGNLCKLNDTNGILDQGGELSFSEKLEMFVTILERCIMETGG